MVYLNAVEAGGQTRFKRIGRDFQPSPGLGLAWNNLDVEGRPNHATLHEALPVIRGHKYVITKWFRSEVGRNL
jgi:prolyl 4-hydroxylase